MPEKHLKHIRISEVVKTEILSGRLYNPLPGMEVLAQRFDTTRITMRNALLILQKEGVVTIKQGQGTSINAEVLLNQEAVSSNLLEMGIMRAAFNRYSSFLTDPDIPTEAKRRMILVVNSQIEIVQSVLPKKP